jgi:hypothetical protein
MSFLVLMVTSINMAVLWNVVQCSTVDINQNF